MGSGGKGGSSTPQYNYYGTIAGRFGCGPIDVLQTILIGGGRILWQGPITRGSELFVDLTGSIDSSFFVNGGYLRFYWGTEHQGPDAALPGQPYYPGSPLLVACNFLFGQDVTTAPDFQIIASRKPVVNPSIVYAGDNFIDDGQVNPIACIAELVTSPAGLNVPLSRLKAASWLAVGSAKNASAAVRALCWCSPLLTSFQPARSVLADLLVLADCELRWTVDGLLEIIARNWGVDPGGLPSFDARHCSDGSPQSLDAAGWDAVPATVEVSFVNRDKLFKSDNVPTPNLWAQQDPNSNLPDVQLQRDHVGRSSQAAAIGAEYLRQNDQPRGTLTRTLRRPLVLTAAGQAVMPGDKVYIDVQPVPSGTAEAQLAVVEEVSFGRTGPVKIRATADTLVGASPYSPAWSVPAPQVYTVDPIAHALAVPLPPAGYGVPPTVGLLLARPGANVVGAHVFFDTDDSGGFPELGLQTGFAVRCTLVNAATIYDSVIRLNLTEGLGGPDAALAARTPESTLGAQQGSLLLVIANVDSNGRVVISGDGLPELEFVFLASRVAVTGATFDYVGLRGRQGLVARAWTTDAQAWIIPAVNLTAWSHPAFAGLAASEAVGYLRLAAYSAFGEDESSPPPERTFIIPTPFLTAPVDQYPVLTLDTGTPGDGNKFVLALVLDETGSIGTAGAARGIAVIDAYTAQIAKICVVAFGDTARLVCPLTTDVASVRAYLVDAAAGTDPAASAFFFDGGGDEPENGIDALALALDTLDAAGITLRRFIYFRTDAGDFAHNVNTPELVNARLNGPITYAWLDITESSSPETTLYTSVFAATSRVSMTDFP